jgi:hypothetical protein
MQSPGESAGKTNVSSNGRSLQTEAMPKLLRGLIGETSTEASDPQKSASYRTIVGRHVRLMEEWNEKKAGLSRNRKKTSEGPVRGAGPHRSKKKSERF